MPTPLAALGDTVWDLPPLILHPFNERVGGATLLENSKAALMLSGLMPGDGSDDDELTRRLLSGRHSEIRMLFFIGKDVFRWIDQCLECAAREEAFHALEMHAQSFARLLTATPPPQVRNKLIRWGVVDYAAIFSRAIGLNVLFAEPPSVEALAEEFVRNYHRYADHLYQCYMESKPHAAISSKNFRFELYASGEYSRRLETEWGAD